MKSEDGSLFTYVTVNKFFSGSYKGKEPFRNMSPLIFKISFIASGKTFTDFIINSIDFASVNFYHAVAGTQSALKPEMQIKPVTRKGFAVSFLGAFGQTTIQNKDVEDLTLEKNSHSWNVSPLYGYIGSLGISYYFSDHIGLRSGAEFNRYATTFSLDGNFTDDEFSVDVNGYQYNRIIEADYDSLVTINYVTIPLLLTYTGGKPGKFGLYAEAGVKFSIPVSVTYASSGNYKFLGYYPSEPYSRLYVDSPEYGFYDRQNIDETGETDMKSMSIAFYSSAGINIPLGYYTSLLIGPEVTIGLSDITGGKDSYTDIFYRSYDHKPTKIRNFGIRISLAYKL